MPTVTLTCTTNMANQPRADHVGLDHLVFSKTQAETGTNVFGTAGDVMLLGKLPNKALLLMLDGKADAQSPGIVVQYALRVHYPFSGGFTVTTISPTINTASGTRMTLLSPYRVSISDSEPIKHATLRLVVTSGASATTSFSVGGVLLYTTDGSDVS